MQLTGKQIIERGIVTGFCQEGLQQQGIDVRLAKVARVESFGYVPKEGKTRLSKRTEIDCSEGNEFVLLPGYYEIEFEEGCQIPNNATLHFKTRSSLVRNGSIIHSGQFDAGFHTDHMGAFLQALTSITIQKGARVAQAIVFESEPVDNTYDGQWQSDKQRK